MAKHTGPAVHISQPWTIPDYTSTCQFYILSHAMACFEQNLQISGGDSVRSTTFSWTTTIHLNLQTWIYHLNTGSCYNTFYLSLTSTYPIKHIKKQLFIHWIILKRSVRLYICSLSLINIHVCEKTTISNLVKIRIFEYIIIKYKVLSCCQCCNLK